MGLPLSARMRQALSEMLSLPEEGPGSLEGQLSSLSGRPIQYILESTWVGEETKGLRLLLHARQSCANLAGDEQWFLLVALFLLLALRTFDVLGVLLTTQCAQTLEAVALMASFGMVGLARLDGAHPRDLRLRLISAGELWQRINAHAPSSTGGSSIPAFLSGQPKAYLWRKHADEWQVVTQPADVLAVAPHGITLSNVAVDESCSVACVVCPGMSEGERLLGRVYRKWIGPCPVVELEPVQPGTGPLPASQSMGVRAS